MYVVMSKLKDRISTDNKHMIKYIKYIINSSLKFEIMAKQLYVASQRVL